MVIEENGHSTGQSGVDTFDVKGSVRALIDAARYHKGLVLFTCAVCVALLTAYIVVFPPIYIAHSTIMVERDSDPVRESFYVGWDTFRKDDARSEIELITASPVLQEVIHNEHLTYKDVYHPFFSHLAYLWQKSAVGRTYRAIKRKILRTDEYGGLTDAQVDEIRNTIDLREGISIESLGESNVDKVSMKGPSRRVSDISNTLLDIYMARRADRYQTEAQRAHDILATQVELAKTDLEREEERRLLFSEKHGLAFDLQKETLEVSKLTELEANIATLNAKIAETQASLGEVDKELQSEPATKTVSTMYEANAARENIKMKRVELQAQLVQMRDRYREDSPEVQEIEGDLAKLDALAAQSAERVEKATTEGLNAIRQDLLSRRGNLSVELEGAKAALVVVNETKVKLWTRLAAVPAIQNDLRDMDRQIGLAQDKYQHLLARRTQADVSLATAKATMPSMRIVEYAATPADKDWPKTKYLYPAAVLVGLILGVLAAVVKNSLRGRISRSHVERARTVPLYGAIAVTTGGRPLIVARKTAQGEMVGSLKARAASASSGRSAS
jgi:uncharacterized protein involved in exopolysaccharide biosynthesis